MLDESFVSFSKPYKARRVFCVDKINKWNAKTQFAVEHFPFDAQSKAFLRR